MSPRLDFHLSLSLSGFHRAAYWEWGDPSAPRTAICLHGLTRQGRDFDFLAQALVEEGYRVVCPDLVGRGRSDWLRPEEYTTMQFCADMNALFARLGVHEVDFIGTSLGGIVGLILAAQPNTPIRRLVINDIGPYVPGAAVRRVGANIRAAPTFFAGIEEAEAYYRRVLAPFGQLTDAQWRHLTVHSLKPSGPDGGFVFHYDRGILVTYDLWWLGSVMLWRYWDRIDCPTLLLRGVESDFLPADVTRAIVARGPRPAVVSFPGVGHAPALMSEEQIAPILSFLGEGRPKPQASERRVQTQAGAAGAAATEDDRAPNFGA